MNFVLKPIIMTYLVDSNPQALYINKVAIEIRDGDMGTMMITHLFIYLFIFVFIKTYFVNPH